MSFGVSGRRKFACNSGCPFAPCWRPRSGNFFVACRKFLLPLLTRLYSFFLFFQWNQAILQLTPVPFVVDLEIKRSYHQLAFVNFVLSNPISPDEGSCVYAQSSTRFFCSSSSSSPTCPSSSFSSSSSLHHQ